MKMQIVRFKVAGEVVRELPVSREMDIREDNQRRIAAVENEIGDCTLAFVMTERDARV